MNHISGGNNLIRMTRKMASLLFVLTCFDSLVSCKYIDYFRYTPDFIWHIAFFQGVDCVSQTEIDQHLTLGMQLLSRGQYSDALSHFHAAIGNVHVSLISTDLAWCETSFQMPIPLTICPITREPQSSWLWADLDQLWLTSIKWFSWKMISLP